ncbi:MAG: glycosyltransferase family 4 protein [Acidobacteriota bacterium]
MGIPHPQGPGGPPKHIPQLIAVLRELGHEVETITYSDCRVQDKTPLSRIRTVARVLWNMARARAKTRPHIIQINSAYDAHAILRDAFIVTLLRWTGAGTRYFVKFHGSDAALLARNGFWRAVTAWTLDRLDAIAVLSTEEATNFKISHPRIAHKIRIVKNIVDVNRFEIRNTSSNRSVWGMSSHDIIFLFISRFVPGKGLLDVITAFSQIHEVFRRARLLLVGDGPERSAAEDLVQVNDLRSKVVFTGYLRNQLATDAYTMSDVLVFPTHNEGFSMTIFDSLAAGLPVLTTRIRAAADYLHEPHNVLWVNKEDPGTLARQMARVIRDADLRKTMGENNRQLARQFNRSSVAADFIAIYNELLPSSQHHDGLSSVQGENHD